MTILYTTNIGLRKPPQNYPNWYVPLDANRDQIDALAPIGGLACRQSEFPSTTLNVRLGAGTFRKPDGTLGSVSSSTQGLTASATNYLYLNSSYAVAVSTTSFPGSGAYVPIATVLTGSTTIISVTDSRLCYMAVGAGTGYLPSSGGTLSDGANIALGTTTGTEFGTATNQLIGFYGATPIVQRTNAAQAAISTLSMGGASVAVIGNTTSVDQASNLNGNFASINGQLVNGAADLAALKALLNEIRTALVTIGLIKGS